MSATLYWYPGCSTCKKAKRWLEDNDVTFETVHLVTSTPSADTLRTLWQASGLPLKKMFNTSGKSYRAGGFSQRLPTMNEDEALAALAADGMLIKRPLLHNGDTVLIGFKEPEWAAAITGVS